VNKTKLVYVLPTYDADSPEHMFHIYGFLEAIAEHLDVLLIIERASGQPDLHNLEVYRRRIQMPILSGLEMLVVMLWARLKGYKRFYTHYSMSAGILSALVTRVLGGVSYYWNCGHPTDFIPKRLRSISDVRCKLRNETLTGLTLHIVHHLVTGTASMARYYSASYQIPLSDICVMPNWVDLRRFSGLSEKRALRQQLGWPVDKKVVLFLHRLAERKGAQYIVPIAQEVLSQLPTLDPQPFFVIAGDGPYRAKLEREIRAAGLLDSFKLAGWVPNREAVQYFSAADVYMMPSTEEGFPRTLLEAMAAQCPFAAMNVGGVQDILTAEQAQFMLPAGDWSGMAGAIARLLADDALRQGLARQGRDHVETYAQERVVQTFVDMVSPWGGACAGGSST